MCRSEPDAPRVGIDCTDVVDLPAPGQAYVHGVHLDELPYPDRHGRDPLLAVAGLHVALVRASGSLRKQIGLMPLSASSSCTMR